MSIKIRLAITEDEQQCSELLDVLAEATSDQNNIFDSNTFNQVISNERGGLVIAEEEGQILGMASVSFNLALRYNGEYCPIRGISCSSRSKRKECRRSFD